MDLIVDLIDKLVEQRIKMALDVGGWSDSRHDLAVLKERLRLVLVENISTGSDTAEAFSARVILAVKRGQETRAL